MTVPDWVQDAVFYQIFPDRFANGDPSNDPPNLQSWGSPPTQRGFQGGDLKGVIDRFNYLLDLGITAIYLNPIFFASSNHRYNTTDYFRIDPKLGKMEDFRTLLKLSHRNHVRIILDGVFNHCGRGFFAFNDLLENGDDSPYKEWFHVKRLPLDAYGPGEAQNYLAWWKHKSLPKFNTDHPQVRRYLLDVARFWIEQGVDGWRLDVPNEIDDDTFWAEFRDVVKAANPFAYLVGEIWEADPRWVGPQHFDGLMNYPLRENLLAFVGQGRITASEFSKRVEDLLGHYPRDHIYAHLFSLSTHDTVRLHTVCEGKNARVRLAFLFQFCFPGPPSIYYGDEIGLGGGKDPDNRRAFPWNKTAWDQDLRGYVKRLIALRRELPQLRRGSFHQILARDATGLYAFSRIYNGKAAAVAMNASDVAQSINLSVSELGWSDGRVVLEGISGQEKAVTNGLINFHLPPLGGSLFFLPY